MPSSLTVRQAQILKLIKDFLAQTGRPPTRAEIAARLGFSSPNAAEEHLRALARKGVLELVPRASRGIRLKPAVKLAGSPPRVGGDAEGHEGLAVIGRVAAGSPILAQEHIEARYRIDPKLFHPHANYLLRVYGMSMRDAGILDGDLLAVHRMPQALNGQIVVARLNDEVTVKRFQRRGHRIRLLPANPEFDPIDIDPRRVALSIEGIGVGVLRNTKLR